MRRVLLVVCGTIAVLLVVNLLVIRDFRKRMQSSFQSAVSEGVAGPLQSPSSSAEEYGEQIGTEASVAVYGKRVTAECKITNKGDRNIRQIVCQINLKNEGGNLVGWQQGPVIRTIREEHGTILKTVSETTILNSFSEQEAPLVPATNVSFSVEFDLGATTFSLPLSADIQLMDVEFYL